MRIRFPFAIAFFILLLFSSSAGLLPHSALPSTPAAAKPYIPAQSDKALHFLSFFALTATFYFILDTTRRRVLHLTLIICTLVLGVGSEVAQGLLPNDRDFDPWDVLANVLGSLCALGLAGAYHKRSTERRRRAKYSALSGEGAEGDDDLELGEGSGMTGANGDVGGSNDSGGQEIGVVQNRSVEEELDNWDENVPDDVWEEDDDDNTTGTGHETKMTPATSSKGSEDIPRKIAVD